MELIDFLKEVNKLKTVKRTGWIVEGIDDVESVAEHSFGTAFLALVLGPERSDIDVNKALKMALIHDIVESQTGDILVDWTIKRHLSKGKKIPEGNHGISEEEKHQIEENAMRSLMGRLENGKHIFDLWKEYEDGKTAEAVFVKGLDKIEMHLQALWYEKEKGADLSRWFTSPKNQPPDPHLKGLYEKILEARKK